MTDAVLPFETLWETAGDVPGWMTEAQARLLWEEASALPAGSVVVEIGSHLGRSAVVLAGALPPGGRLVAVDPFLPDWRYGEPDTEARFREHLRLAGVADRVDVRVATSEQVLRDWTGPVALVHVDGKHDYWSVRHDLGWADHLPVGGHLLLHDTFSSLGVTLGVLARALSPRAPAYLGREGSLATFAAGPADLRARARLLAPLPWFARNLVVKVLLRLRLRAVARLLGHHDLADPY
ncbi:class I SAM-dependent methyltransferase [Nocardioides solisilvae]|uniref:class I SAM-dependent methyltransferase n=1 Tax=Nocardioides solisilvae TaxID=1542435 RepID=UPI000D74401C|nr:class I SAM-dependent methyltransferase [Nocardioides solisilvae]